MATLNPALFEPLKRLEDAARRAGGVLFTAPDVSPTKDEMIAKEIQEMRDALQALKPGKWQVFRMVRFVRMAAHDWSGRGRKKRAGKGRLRPFPAVNGLAEAKFLTSARIRSGFGKALCLWIDSCLESKFGLRRERTLTISQE